MTGHFGEISPISSLFPRPAPWFRRSANRIGLISALLYPNSPLTPAIGLISALSPFEAAGTPGRTGYLPPDEFLPELMMARGHAAMLHGQYAQAFEIFVEVAQKHPDAAAAPEAMYYAGAAALRRDDKPDGLIAQWQQLKQRYPNSVWWKSASFIEN